MLPQFMSKFLGENVIAVYEDLNMLGNHRQRNRLSTGSGLVLRDRDTNSSWSGTRLNTCLWQPSIKVP